MKEETVAKNKKCIAEQGDESTRKKKMYYTMNKRL